MTEHSLEGLHFHVTEAYVTDGGAHWFRRKCVSGQELHDLDEAKATEPDMGWISAFANDPPGMHELRRAMLGIEYDAAVEVPAFDVPSAKLADEISPIEVPNVPRPSWPREGHEP